MNELELNELAYLRHSIHETIGKLDRDIAKYERRSDEVGIDDYYIKISTCKYQKNLLESADRKIAIMIGQKAFTQGDLPFA